MKRLIKQIWIPIVIAISLIFIFAFFRIIPGVFIALFESEFLMYIWYDLFLFTIIASTVIVIRTSEKLGSKYKILYYCISFIIISNTYYGLGVNGLFVNLFYM